MTPSLDRSRVRSSFDRGAAAYERHAEVQRRVVGRLLADLSGFPNPRRVLDVGSGTGMLLQGIRRMFPGTLAVGVDLAHGMNRKAYEALGGETLLVTADAERLPFADRSFDLVVSSSALQWLETLEAAFTEVRRVLADGGRFLFAMFGEGTLMELQDCYRTALDECGCRGIDRAHRFFTPDEVRRSLLHAGFRDVEVSHAPESVRHADVPELLRGLREIGAGNASSARGRGLGEARVMLRMMEHYRNRYGDGDGITATYGVVYGSCRCD
ncbi:MAG TPA: methyltransferase domain-containing protein [Verrucomicrobiae bacterium]|nr:methyltransferase domain-containing protein [Verrucomicrobiae bacterium]